MEVFHIFQIVQMVPNRTKYHQCFSRFARFPVYIYFDNPGIVLGYVLAVMFIMTPQLQLKATDWVQNTFLIYVSIIIGSNKLRRAQF